MVPVLEFRSNHTVAGKYVPEMLFLDWESSEIISFEGTWEIIRELDEVRIKLKIDKRNGVSVDYESYMEVSNWMGKLRLFFWIGEPGEGRYSFEKADTEM
jgi:hypothetical protein